MRLDKFLKVSRVIKRRSVANEACDLGRVKINEKVAKAFSEVKVGDIIEIKFGENWAKFEVLNLTQSIKKEDANNMVKVIEG